MKGIVEGQCGQSNALVGLSKNFAQNNARLNTGVDGQIRGVMPGLARGDQLADEYLRGFSAQTAAPSTFNMRSLAHNLPQQGRSSSASDLSRAWATDFSRRQPSMITSPLANQWTQQYFSTQSPQSSLSSVSTTQHELESIWNQSQQRASVIFGFDEADLASASLIYKVFQDNCFRQTQMWPSEYLDSFDSGLNSAHTLGNDWANQFEERQKTMPETFHNFYDEMTKDYQTEWDAIGETINDDILQMNPTIDYIFQSSNPFISEDNLTSKGAEMLKNGNIAEAIQYYEAAVQQNPQDANAWCQLGLSLAENEQDAKAISALRKALEIDPVHQEALIAISVSLANESMENEALAQLEKWIQNYTNKSSPVSTVSPAPFSRYSNLDLNKFREVETMFLDAARKQSPQNVDPNLQNALGILYNISRNFERAIDSLNTALAAKPDDARLWNRLGATLANNDRTPQAIEAYRQALTLFPTFVRARYNLGISCMHLKSYKDAVEHFLSALQIQKSPANSPIWSTLRSAVMRISNVSDTFPNLIAAVDTRDVNIFAQEFSKIR